jgi:hypothetical protein
MKLVALATSGALALAALAGSASAQVQAVNGTVGITGVVTAKCFVGAVGTGGGTTFSDTMALGEIDQSNGTILGTLASSTAVAAAIKTFTVTCTGSDATVDLSADQFNNTTNTGTPASGQANKINYTAELDATLSAGGPFTLTATPGSPNSGNLGAPLSTTSNNITVKAYSFIPVGGTGMQLVAGNYSGTIHVTITPIA